MDNAINVSGTTVKPLFNYESRSLICLEIRLFFGSVNSFFDKRKSSPTFDQLNVFLTVVEEKGFAAAARRLGRRQSAVSYTIGALEAQLGGISLFDRSTHRPTLTEIGAALLADARRISREMDGLQAHIEGLVAGVEPELSLVFDVMLPNGPLATTLHDLRQEFPNVSLRIRFETLGGVAASLLSGTASIGVCGPLLYRIDGLADEKIGATALIPVAAPGHPLARRPGRIPNRDARTHTQIVLTDRSNLSRGQDFAVLASETTRVPDLQAKHCMILAGLGWGALPEHLVRDDLATGRLRTLAFIEWAQRSYPFHVLHRVDTPPGPAGRWLVDCLGRHLA